MPRFLRNAHGLTTQKMSRFDILVFAVSAFLQDDVRSYKATLTGIADQQRRGFSRPAIPQHGCPSPKRRGILQLPYKVETGGAGI
jgi:hypothetical protein